MNKFIVLNWENEAIFVGDFPEAKEVLKTKSGKEPYPRTMRRATEVEVKIWLTKNGTV